MLRAKQEVSLLHLQQRPGVVFSFIFMEYVITAAWKRDKPQFQHPLRFSFSQCSISSLSRLTSLHLLSQALQSYLKGFSPVTFTSSFSPPSIHHSSGSRLPFLQCNCHCFRDLLLYASLIFLSKTS